MVLLPSFLGHFIKWPIYHVSFSSWNPFIQLTAIPFRRVWYKAPTTACKALPDLSSEKLSCLISLSPFLHILLSNHQKKTILYASNAPFFFCLKHSPFYWRTLTPPSRLILDISWESFLKPSKSRLWVPPLSSLVAWSSPLCYIEIICSLQFTSMNTRIIQYHICIA